MLNRQKKQDMDDVIAGMVLAEAVHDSHGGVLLPSATTLTEAMLTSLRRRGIDSVFIVNNAISEAELEAERERIRKRLAELFRHCSSNRACAVLAQRILEYRSGETA